MDFVNVIKDKDGRTWATLTNVYTGKDYPVRVIYDKDGNPLYVGNDDLLNDIHPYDWNHKEFEGFDPRNPKMAEETYNEIFFFTDDTTFFDWSDKALRKDVAAENPDFF